MSSVCVALPWCPAVAAFWWGMPPPVSCGGACAGGGAGCRAAPGAAPHGAGAPGAAPEPPSRACIARRRRVAARVRVLAAKGAHTLCRLDTGAGAWSFANSLGT